jgi:MoaA/NifB/PqqE/SkfB family radical SAM enzyme
MSCSHCLQQKIRTRIRNEWIPTKAARQALHDAWFAGLLTTGVNFTGGEVFSARSNLVELVETARALGLAFRIYTNGWWGNRRTVSLGDMVFHSPREVIEWIHSQGVSILALSFDARYDEAPESWPPVMSIIRHCEAVGQQYQVVCTGERGQDLIDRMYRRLREHRINPAFLSPVPMESVDIGGACARAAETARGLQDLALLARRSPCETKGFARPKFLHIGPRGDVRSCLYAVGCGYLGNITRESIFQILNSFNSNPVTRLFREGETSAFLDEYFHPYQKFYRNIGHPCTASVLIARMAEELAVTTPQFVSGRRKEELHRLHLRIAEDLNLCAS